MVVDTFYPVTVSQLSFFSIAQLGMSLWQMAWWLLVLDIEAVEVDKELHDVRDQMTVLEKDSVTSFQGCDYLKHKTIFVV